MSWQLYLALIRINSSAILSAASGMKKAEDAALILARRLAVSMPVCSAACCRGS
ncbi:MAG: hypothetical protein ABR884_01525 [Minisyncoccia bacterium]